MPYAFTLSTTLPASAHEIYDAWLDSAGHSEMTGGRAVMSNALDAEVSAWDGYISGRNLELVPGERIVQSWRTTRFTDEHEDSIITVTLVPVPNGTLVTLVHSNVPDDHTSYEQGGWQTHYFEPMLAYFVAKEPPGDVVPPPAASTARVKPRRARKATSRKSKSELPQAKPAATPKKAPAKKKSKRVPAAKKSKPKVKRAKTAKKMARKSAPKARRGKRHR